MADFKPVCACCGESLVCGIHRAEATVKWNEVLGEFQVTDFEIESFMCPHCNCEAPYCEWEV